MDEKRNCGIICEHKLDGPLIWEGKPMTPTQAMELLNERMRDSRLIRGAVFEMTFVNGNETLIEKED